MIKGLIFPNSLNEEYTQQSLQSTIYPEKSLENYQENLDRA